MTEENPKPGYKQAWPWFVISIPLLTVVAGIITFMIAANKPHSMVQDDYFKKGLAINQSLAKQEKAKELGLNGVLQMESDAGLLTVKFEGETVAAKQIKLIFSHPTKENFDKIVTLDKLANNEYIGQLPQLAKAYWYVRILDTEESWLIKTRWSIPGDKQISLDAANA